MTPEEAAVMEIARILKGADPEGVLVEAGTLALALGVSVEDFQLALRVSGEVAPEESLREFLVGLTGRSPEARQTLLNLGLCFYAADGNLLSIPAIAVALNHHLRFFGRNVALAIVETIFGGGAPTALGLMAIAKERGA